MIYKIFVYNKLWMKLLNQEKIFFTESRKDFFFLKIYGKINW